MKVEQLTLKGFDAERAAKTLKNMIRARGCNMPKFKVKPFLERDFADELFLFRFWTVMAPWFEEQYSEFFSGALGKKVVLTELSIGANKLARELVCKMLGGVVPFKDHRGKPSHRLKSLRTALQVWGEYEVDHEPKRSVTIEEVIKMQEENTTEVGTPVPSAAFGKTKTDKKKAATKKAPTKKKSATKKAPTKKAPAKKKSATKKAPTKKAPAKKKSAARSGGSRTTYSDDLKLSRGSEPVGAIREAINKLIPTSGISIGALLPKILKLAEAKGKDETWARSYISSGVRLGFMKTK